MTAVGARISETVCRFLTVVVGGELFAIDIAQIREVIHCPRITRVPLSPAVVPGVINLRGAVVAVVDLSERLGRGPTRIGRRSCIVVIEVIMDERLTPVGLLVDAVEEAVETSPRMLEPRAAFGMDFRHDFQSAMLRMGSRFVPVLDMAVVAEPAQLEALVKHGDGRADLRGYARS